MIKIELKYIPINNDLTEGEVSSRTKHQRNFTIDYLTVDREINVSEMEFKFMREADSIILCGVAYSVVTFEFKIEPDMNSWLLVIQNKDDIPMEYDDWETDLPF
jgi:hypothetical protein